MLTFPKYSNRSIKCLALLLQILKHIHNLFVIFWATLSPLQIVILQSESPFTCLPYWIPLSLDLMSSSFYLDCFICWTTNSSKILSRKGAWEITFLNFWVSEISLFFLCLQWWFGWALEGIAGSIGFESFSACVERLMLFWFFILSKRPGSFLWKCVWLSSFPLFWNVTEYAFVRAYFHSLDWVLDGSLSTSKGEFLFFW